MGEIHPTEINANDFFSPFKDIHLEALRSRSDLVGLT
jgi:hypothetical protein